MYAGGAAQIVIDRLATPSAWRSSVDEDGLLRAFDSENYGDRQIKLLARFSGGAALRVGAAPRQIRNRVAADFEGELDTLSALPWRSSGSAFQMGCW